VGASFFRKVTGCTRYASGLNVVKVSVADVRVEHEVRLML
jgi:hypothetical protein